VIPDNRLIVFNRWGDVVFEQRGYDNTWGGANDVGEPLPDGTYYYILYLNISERLIFRGHVTVIRTRSR